MVTSKFYAVLSNRERPILCDGNRMEKDESFVYVYDDSELTAVIDRGVIVYAYFSEQGRNGRSNDELS
ncbi:MAG: hypothetical protein J6A79_11940 [Clostridia bacterium]|nr:hypothetical protein [Clostridia bacterium]